MPLHLPRVLRADRRESWRRPGVIGGVVSVLLVFYCTIVVFLIVNTAFASLKHSSELIMNIIGPPRAVTFENYHRVLVVDGFYKLFFNSLTLVVLGTVASVFVAALTAYGIARYSFKGKAFVQTFFLVGLMFPIQLGILPIFIILRTLRLTNTFAGMILIYIANMSFSVFIMTKFFEKLPAELYDSAKIDGAGEFRIFLQIMMPISRPVVATVALIKAVNIWNDFYMPLVILTRRSVQTLTLGIYWYVSNFFVNWHLVFSAVTFSTVPILVLFLLFQQQFVEGLTAGSLKQ